MNPIGEYPPLPPDVVRELRREASAKRARIADKMWSAWAAGQIMIFEGGTK